MSDPEWLTDLTAVHRLRVRYGETDQMGVVYHPNYLIWFNEARDHWLASRGQSAERLERSGWRFPVVEIGCRYLAPARYGDEVLVFVTPRRTTVARFTFRYDIRHAHTRRLLASGRTTSVITDHDGHLLIRLPAELAGILIVHRAFATSSTTRR